MRTLLFRGVAGCALTAFFLVCDLPLAGGLRPVHRSDPRLAEAEKTRREAAERIVPAPDDVAEPPADALRNESGLVSRLLQDGAGTIPAGPHDLVTLRYTGWTTDGAMFDTTGPEGAPRTFRVDRVIDGFGEALQLMVEGEKRRIWIPAGLAYLDRPERPQGTLVFDVEMISIRRAPPTPLDVGAAPPDALRSASGLAYRVLREGGSDGERPGPEDMVLVDYTSWKADGAMVDSSVLDGQPTHFSLDLTIPAFAEAFQQMAPGERRRLWVPQELTILDGEPKADGPMVFDVELLSFIRKPTTPQNLAVPPADAERSISGVASKLLRAGHGSRHPEPNQLVEVHYAGWTRDGKMFDASFNHGRAGEFRLDDSMPIGWNEALRSMVEGERRLIWIPEELAYGGRDGRPKGMLIFDVELLSIREE